MPKPTVTTAPRWRHSLIRLKTTHALVALGALVGAIITHSGGAF